MSINNNMYIESNCTYCGKIVIRKKQSKLANVKMHFCNLECKANYQRLSKPVDKDWLYEQYVVNGKNCVEIGKMVCRHPKSVWNWLKDFGIETRKRGYASPDNYFKKGQNWWTGKKHPPEFSIKLREARLKDGRYPKQENGLPYWKGKRGVSWQGGITPERQAVYASIEWKGCVKIVWKRDNGICQRCGLDYRTVNNKFIKFAIHHIITFKDKSQRLNPEILVLVCGKCHHFIHSKLNIDKEWLA